MPLPKTASKPKALSSPGDCTLKPLGDRVVIRRDTADEYTRGGLALPASMIKAEKPRRGLVLAIGDGSILKDGTVHKMSVKVGETVYFNNYPGAEFEHGPERELLVVIREHDILGVDLTAK